MRLSPLALRPAVSDSLPTFAVLSRKDLPVLASPPSPATAPANGAICLAALTLPYTSLSYISPFDLDDVDSCSMSTGQLPGMGG